ncbi:MAG: maleylpyruvate isomerase family mycothiol-dependent enzyme, partial [Candidatus Dormiibacterota bacterium]
MLTLIEFSTFLKHLQSDGDRLALVARNHLANEVPSCPGWTVHEVVTHVAEVYEHKIACTLLQANPDPWPPRWPSEREPLEWFADAHQRLLTLLGERGPEAPSYTWWPADQTVGFWARRMAQETVIHRVDVELSRGLSSSVDPELAVDGVDEVLVVFLGGDWSEAPSD